MCGTACSDRGSTLIEALIAIVLVSIGLIGLTSMQPTSWQASARADYLGRAAMMISQEITQQEVWIMNPCNTVSAGTTTQSVNVSGQATSQSGDAVFTIQTTITNIGTNTWQVTVRITWPPLNTTGITESIVVTRQENFRRGCV